MKLWISLGTAAELIKIYPLLHMASKRHIPWVVLSTGQSAVNFWKQWYDFGLPHEQALILQDSTEDLSSSQKAFYWFRRAIMKSKRDLIKALPAVSKDDCWIVHGDTLSTLVGSRYANMLGVPLAHVEAGLRSSSILSPFPEEITRRMVSRWANWHFAPGDLPANAITKSRHRAGSHIVNTHHNTLLDTLKIQLQSDIASDVSSGTVIVNIHRFENINNPKKWKSIVAIVQRAAKNRRVLFVMHPITAHKFSIDKSSYMLLKEENISFMERQVFTSFIRMLHGADFVISDGGSNQEECHYLGKPCLILRSHTERPEGLGGCCLLSEFSTSKIDKFLENPLVWRRPPVNAIENPSAIILDHLLKADRNLIGAS